MDKDTQVLHKNNLYTTGMYYMTPAGYIGTLLGVVGGCLEVAVGGDTGRLVRADYLVPVDTKILGTVDKYRECGWYRCHVDGRIRAIFYEDGWWCDENYTALVANEIKIIPRLS